MGFEGSAKKYLRALQNDFNDAQQSRSATPELSYRPALHSFFKTIALASGSKDIVTIYEPNMQLTAGRPDWRFHSRSSLNIFGYIESKGLNINMQLSASDHKKQLEKYFRVGHPVILTDGIEFIFFKPGGASHSYSLVDKPLSKKIDWSTLKINNEVGIAFSTFFRESSTHDMSNAHIMEALASRAKNMSEEIEQYISLDVGEGLNAHENQIIDTLHKVKEILQNQHDPELATNDRFAKAVAQVLIFGVFYAHRQILDDHLSTDDIAYRLKNYWQDATQDDESRRKLKPFKALAELLAKDENVLSPMNVWYTDCLLLLSHIKPYNIKQSPAYHELYECFLKSFDKQDRIDFGVYSTPDYLAQYMVAFAFRLSERELHTTVFSEGTKIIDPCCGTGTFLEALVKIMEQIRPDASKIPTIVGFEIQAAPYALSQYRMAYLQRQGYSAAREVHVVLCNTLSDYVTLNNRQRLESKSKVEIIQLLRAERQEAAAYAKPPITVIIGNPPSSDAGLHTDKSMCGKILELVDDFRPPQTARSARQNTQKQLQNDFIKFVRWSCHKLAETKYGMLALIIPSSFLQHNTYEYARKWMTEHFSSIWILEFDADARTGVKTENIFDTMQGRCVITCAISDKNRLCKTVNYLSIAQLDKKQKEAYLTETYDKLLHNTENFAFSAIDVSAETSWSFRPGMQYDRERYSLYWPLVAAEGTSDLPQNSIFYHHSSGLKLGVTGALVHADQAMLRRRIKDLASEQSFTAIYEKWFKGQSKPPAEDKLNHKVRMQIRSILDRNHGTVPDIISYSFRPFITLHAFLSEGLLDTLSAESSGGTRSRPEVRAAFKWQENIGIAIAPAPKDLGDELHRFASFAWHLPDNDLCARGNAHIFALKFPEYKTSKNWEDTLKSNINQHLVEKLAQCGLPKTGIQETVLYYTYAVLCSNAYLRKCEGPLFKTAGSWSQIRIPITRNSDLFTGIADYGKQIAKMELEPDRIPENKFKFDEFLLMNYKIDANLGTITAIGPNDTGFIIKGLNKDILEYRISGHHILDSWLKRRCSPYLQRSFRATDFTELKMLIRRLQTQIKLISQLDLLVTSVLTSSQDELLRIEEK